MYFKNFEEKVSIRTLQSGLFEKIKFTTISHRILLEVINYSNHKKLFLIFKFNRTFFIKYNY